MKLVIVCGFQRTEINDIFVDDEGNPSVCGQKVLIIDEETGEQITLQPGIWFKVMVLDSIVVDCTKRVLQWKCKSNEKENESAKTNELNHQMIANMNVYDHQLRLWTQLFELGREILENELQNDGSDEGETCEVKAIRLLYCFALPLISFERSSILAFRHSKEYIVSLLTALDSKLDERIRTLDSQRTSLKEQRLYFWPNLLVSDNIEGFDLRLLEDMLNHVDSDIKDISDQLDSASKDCEHLQTVPCPDPSLEQQTKDRRSVLHRKLAQIKVASEEVRFRHTDAGNQRQHGVGNDWERRKSRKHLLRTYLNGYTGLKRVRKQVETLMTTKIRLMAAREAIDSCIRMLEAGQSTGGPGTSLDGEPTEVDLPLGTLPWGWCSTSEKVRMITCDPQSRVHEVMRAGQRDVVRILGDATLLIHRSIEEGSLSSASLDVLQPDPVILSTSVRSKIDEFKQYLHSHMTTAVDELRRALGEPSLSSKLLYVCYQHHFYLLVMKQISSFYELVYADIVRSLYEEFLTKLTYKDLCVNGNSDENWLLDIANFKNVEDIVNSNPCQSLSLLIPRLVGQSVFYITYIEQSPKREGNGTSETSETTVDTNARRKSQSSEEQEEAPKTERPFEEVFAKEIGLLMSVPEKLTPFDQVECLVDFLQKIAIHLNNLVASDNVGTDYLSAFLPLLLCKCDSAFAAIFYARLQFLIDSNPECLQEGMHAFTMTTLLGSYIHIFNAGTTRSRLSRSVAES